MISHHTTLSRAVLTRRDFVKSLSLDYEGLACDWCGIPLDVGDLRLCLRSWFTYGNGYLRHGDATWWLCSEACAGHAREELG